MDQQIETRFGEKQSINNAVCHKEGALGMMHLLHVQLVSLP